MGWIFSEAALKFRITRCCIAGINIDFISDGLTLYRPSSSAFALEASISAWPARGPAPQSTYSFIHFIVV